MRDKSQAAVLPPRELAAFFEALAMLLASGVPANECPGIIATDMESGPLAGAAEGLAAILAAGEVYALSDALAASGRFPAYAVDMLRLGEEAGRMENTAAALAAYYERQHSLNAGIRSAIGGPLLLVGIMAVVLVFLLAIVLPVFEGVFASLGLAGGGLGGAFLAARVAMAAVGLVLLAVLALALLYLLGGGQRLAALAGRFGPTRRIGYSVSASRLTGALEMLLASGLSAGEALERAQVLVTNRQMAACLPACRQAVAGGQDLAAALVDTGVLAGFEARVLLSASRAGQTQAAMQKLAALYAAQADEGIDRLLGLVEPALVGILSVAIGVILLSVMLPLTRIMGAIG